MESPIDIPEEIVLKILAELPEYYMRNAKLVNKSISSKLQEDKYKSYLEEKVLVPLTKEDISCGLYGQKDGHIPVRIINHILFHPMV